MPRVVPSQVVRFIVDELKFAVDDCTDQSGSITGENCAGTLQALTDLIAMIPGQLITIDGQLHSTFVKAIASIRHIQRRWLTSPSDRLPNIAKRTPVAWIHDALLQCPDEMPLENASGLDFIQDEGLRVALRLDAVRVDQALTHGEWKAATVLAGSLTEALLLWAIQQQSEKDLEGAITARAATTGTRAKGDPTNWHLHEYIEIAEELTIVTPDTAKQARLAKDFRNLIHPGRSQRLAQVCDRATALSAVAAVEHVIRDLTRGSW